MGRKRAAVFASLKSAPHALYWRGHSTSAVVHKLNRRFRDSDEKVKQPYTSTRVIENYCARARVERVRLHVGQK